MKGKIKSQIISIFLTITMVLPLLSMPVQAATYVSKEDYQANDAYCYIVDAKTGNVLQSSDKASDPMTVNNLGKDGNQLPSEALFKYWAKNDNQQLVTFINSATGKVICRDGGNAFVHSDGQKPSVPGGWEAFTMIVDEVNKDAVKLQAYEGKWVYVDNNQLSLTSNTNEASSFYIIQAKYQDTSMYFENKASKKLIKASGNNGSNLTIDGQKENGVVPENCRFNQVGYGNFDNFEVTNFQSKLYPDLAWKSGSSDYIFLNNAVISSGWESIIVVPNGDGTISFKSSENKSYYSVSDNKLKRGYTGELTDNEKFIVHTVLKPASVTNVTTKNIEGQSATISWMVFKRHFIVGIKLL